MDFFKSSIKENKYTDICPLRIKRLFSYKDYDYLITIFVPSLKYTIRGFYFNTLNPKHNNHLFLYPNNSHKNKMNKMTTTSQTKSDPSSKCVSKIGTTTIVKMKTFEIRKTMQPEVFDLYCLNEGVISKYSCARISTLKISKLIYRLFSERETVYVNCKFNSNFNKWEPFEESDRDKLCDIKYLN